VFLIVLRFIDDEWKINKIAYDLLKNVNKMFAKNNFNSTIIIAGTINTDKSN